MELIDLIARVPKEIQRSAKEMKTLYLANLAYDLAQAYNNFYRLCPVIQADENVKNYRLRLSAAARQAIVVCLAILGIETPEMM